MERTWNPNIEIRDSRTDRKPEPHTLIPWDDVCRRLTEWTNRPLTRHEVRKHVKHRDFGPYNDDGVETLIDGAISADILTEREDGRLEYYGEFVSIPMTHGEFQLELRSA